MSERKTLFITGATGYLGGSLLSYLNSRFRQTGFEIDFRTLVRTEAKANRVIEWAKKRQLTNITTVLGTLEDSQLLTEEASKADIIIDTADTDSVPGITGILNGIELAIENGRTNIILVHTSGTGMLTDTSVGMYGGTEIFHDDAEEEIAKVSKTAPHRVVDNLIEDFQKKHQGKVNTILIAPSTVWGLGFGPDSLFSVQLPGLIRFALSYNQAYHIGKGENIWNQINIADAAELYYLAIAKSLQEPGKHNGLYFVEYGGEAGEYKCKEMTQAIQTGLVHLGRSTEPKSKDVSDEDYMRIFGAAFGEHAEEIKIYAGGNCRARGERAKDLGWKPTSSSKEAFLSYASIEPIIISKIENL